MNELTITIRNPLQEKPNKETQLGFGKIFTDHMLQMDYTPEKGWHNPNILPYGPISVMPTNASFHYGQLVFEGLKAYITESGKPAMFRPMENLNRLNKSSERLCIPKINKEETLSYIKALVNLEKDWIPTASGSSLYIRPFIMAADNFLSVRPSNNYTFFTVLSPVGKYYKDGFSPTRIFVEEELVRAVKGGTGEAKGAGNYGASLMAQKKANEQGFAQVLWLDGVERKYIEEVGTSNVFFVIDEKVVTPNLNGSILPGITRDSTIKLLKSLDTIVEERKISMEEIISANKNGSLKEAFATGTAAVVSPIGELSYKNEIIKINNGEVGEIAQKVFDNLTGIQLGKIEDSFGWVEYL